MKGLNVFAEWRIIASHSQNVAWQGSLAGGSVRRRISTGEFGCGELKLFVNLMFQQGQKTKGTVGLETSWRPFQPELLQGPGWAEETSKRGEIDSNKTGDTVIRLQQLAGEAPRFLLARSRADIKPEKPLDPALHGAHLEMGKGPELIPEAAQPPAGRFQLARVRVALCPWGQLPPHAGGQHHIALFPFRYLLNKSKKEREREGRELGTVALGAAAHAGSTGAGQSRTWNTACHKRSPWSLKSKQRKRVTGYVQLDFPNMLSSMRVSKFFSSLCGTESALGPCQESLQSANSTFD
ncbi:hypothetical protein QYF61_000793 [Mycteria americana]|uniref:Uncharacterized protein n=1 Tax=Mycteria americana TaxID=33587 RepID=A0AAN7SHV0_MYCAM|nr:hypothetical protein QYF61_000793 [Mycteria americana]